MRRIALVGDIGSGKTFISKLFKYPVFNADNEVSKIYKKNKKFLQNTLNYFLIVNSTNYSLHWTTGKNIMPVQKCFYLMMVTPNTTTGLNHTASCINTVNFLRVCGRQTRKD